jgi:threonine/homoserine/homoserine lactone efflux protein
MSLETWLLFASAALVVILIPGPPRCQASCRLS